MKYDLVQIRKTLKNKIENCKNDIRHHQEKCKAIIREIEEDNYLSLHNENAYNYEMRQIERLRGELDAYIDVMLLCNHVWNEE